MLRPSIILDEVVGHDDSIMKLKAAFLNESYRNEGQCFLFLGPEGVGKKLVALGLAQLLLCEKAFQNNLREHHALDVSACGQCGSCLRVANQQSESIKIVEPEGVQIKIEQAREVVDYLSYKSWGHHRVVIIDGVHLMNPQSSNLLLKSLEEPPSRTVFFLLSSSMGGVLSTVRSRSRLIQFYPVQVQDMIEWKESHEASHQESGNQKLDKQKSKKQKSGNPPSIPNWAIGACHGSFSRLLEFSTESEFEVRKAAAQSLIYFIEDQEFLTNDYWRNGLKERVEAQKTLQYWSLFCRDGYYQSIGQTGRVVNQDLKELQRALSKIGTDQLLDMWYDSIEVERAIGTSRDTQLLVESWWVQSHR